MPGVQRNQFEEHQELAPLAWLRELLPVASQHLLCRTREINNLIGCSAHKLGTDSLNYFCDQKILGAEVSQQSRMGDPKCISCWTKGQPSDSVVEYVVGDGFEKLGATVVVASCPPVNLGRRNVGHHRRLLPLAYPNHSVDQTIRFG